MIEDKKQDVCHICGAQAFKTDGKGNGWCKKCINKEMHPQMVRAEKKIGRNDKCLCGSGKKYKKCCAVWKKIKYIKS